MRLFFPVKYTSQLPVDLIASLNIGEFGGKFQLEDLNVVGFVILKLTPEII